MIRSSFEWRDKPLMSGSCCDDGGTRWPSLRCTFSFDAMRPNHNLSYANVRWMMLHPSANVPHATGHNQNPRWKTLRGFPPYGRATGPRYQL
ncbi:hypothetical protein C1896_08225 [Pseudomonadaceae bacterium SI-3]|nr:hypothetical protein C1896_08225 [Pseudomonadaceae bacterium SI-3]